MPRVEYDVTHKKPHSLFSFPRINMDQQDQMKKEEMQPSQLVEADVKKMAQDLEHIKCILDRRFPALGVKYSPGGLPERRVHERKAEESFARGVVAFLAILLLGVLVWTLWTLWPVQVVPPPPDHITPAFEAWDLNAPGLCVD